MRELWRALRIARLHQNAAYAGAADDARLLSTLADVDPERGRPSSPSSGGTDPDPERQRIHALVDLAVQGDAEAFGQLYDHYVTGIYRFVYYRVGSRQLAEDLTSETFVRALRSMNRFSWQGKDFGAWLTTIARNLITDHFKSSRTRLEFAAEAIPDEQTGQPTPEEEVATRDANRTLMQAVDALPAEQRDCIVMRFIQGLSIAQTAASLGRSEGAVKQLQLRAIRRLAKSVPTEIR